MTTDYHAHVEEENEVLEDSDILYEAQSFDAHQDDPEIGSRENQEDTFDGQIANGA